MECPEGTVKTRLKKARQILKEKVSEYEKEFGVSLAAMGGVPFLTNFFTESARHFHPKAIPVFKMPNVGAPAANMAAAKLSTAAIGKIVAGVLAGTALLGAGGFLIANQIKNSEQNKGPYVINLNDYLTFDLKESKDVVDVEGIFDSKTVNELIAQNLKNDDSFDISNYITYHISYTQTNGFNMRNGDEATVSWTVDEAALQLFESENNIDIVCSDYVYTVKDQDFGAYDILNKVEIEYDNADSEADVTGGTADYIFCTNLRINDSGLGFKTLKGVKYSVDGYSEEELKTHIFQTGDEITIKLELCDSNYSSVEDYCKSLGFSSVVTTRTYTFGLKETNIDWDDIRSNPENYYNPTMKDYIENSEELIGVKYILLVRKEEYGKKPYKVTLKNPLLTDGDRYIQPYILVTYTADQKAKDSEAVSYDSYGSFTCFINWDLLWGENSEVIKKNVMKYFVDPVAEYYDIEYLN